MSIRELLSFSCLLASAFAAGASAASDLVTIAAENGRYSAWPTVCRRANGEIVVTYSGDRIGHVCRCGKVRMVRSSDEGKTWSAPVTVWDGILDDRDSGITELKDGTLFVNWFTSDEFATYANGRGVNPGDRAYYDQLDRKAADAAIGCWCARSTDDGKTWSAPVRMPVTLPHSPAVLKDGRLLCVGRRYEELHQPANDLLCVASSDGGRTWATLYAFKDDEWFKMVSAHEPSVAELPDARLVCHLRYNDGVYGGLLQSESADGGRTWSAPHTTCFTDERYPGHLLVLGDGRLLATYGRRAKGAFGECACISEDGGKTWDLSKEIRLTESFTTDLGYPSSAQLPSGDVLSVFYEPERPRGPASIRMVRWTPPLKTDKGESK